jgi:predicted methyltransferase
MLPVNQFILGNSDPMATSLDNLDNQIQLMESYRNRLNQLQQQQQVVHSVWNEIDAEILPLSEEQKSKLMADSEYSEIYKRLQELVQNEILNLVKSKIENTDKGKELLGKQLSIIKKLKTKIINDTNIEMELFKKFKEYTKNNPNITYEEFLKKI